MRLIPHPDFGFPEGLAIDATATGSNDGDLQINYHLSFTRETLSLRDPATPTRADDLWKTTCFELFVGAADSAGYWEFNFSPSGEWAAYAFTGYRSGMRDLELLTPPTLTIKRGETGLILTARLSGLGAKMGSPAIEAGLTAVAEAKDGTKSYWALAHAEGPPDFHSRDCFTLKLAPPGNS